MTYWFQQFLSKKNLVIYSSTWLLSLIIGGLYLFYSKNHTDMLSLSLMLLSLFLFFVIFMAVETEQIYRSFKTTQLRLLPVSVLRIYLYRLLFSFLVGVFFTMGHLIISFIMYFAWTGIAFTFAVSGFELLLGALDVSNLFLLVQLLVYSSISLLKFVPKRYRSLLSLILFMVMATLFDSFVSISSSVTRSFLGMYVEQLSEVSIRLLVQMIGNFVSIGLTCWLIDRYVEAEG
ncbi:hypothetical protein [Enterococcus sp. UD-01]|jgi:hypothetical protein|uniref:hypothetical protein n=1 Tax=Enterococcus sp. UD-01 TaxID=3373911 RepID=UPI0038343B3A